METTETERFIQPLPIETNLSFSTHLQDFFRREPNSKEEDIGEEISFPCTYGNLNTSFLNTTHDEFNFHLYNVADEFVSNGYMYS